MSSFFLSLFAPAILSMASNSEIRVCDEVCHLQAHEAEVIEVLTSIANSEEKWPWQLTPIFAYDDYYECGAKMIETGSTKPFSDFGQTDSLLMKAYSSCEKERVIGDQTMIKIFDQRRVALPIDQQMTFTTNMRSHAFIFGVILEPWTPESKCSAKAYALSRFPQVARFMEENGPEEAAGSESAETQIDECPESKINAQNK